MTNQLIFFDTQTSKQQAFQKRFYQQALHQQQGKFSQVLSHLLENDKLWQISSDEESDETPVTSNRTIDMSNIDFNTSLTQASSLTSNIIEKKQLLQEPSRIPSEKPTQIPSIITDSVQSLSTFDHQLNPLDGNEFYCEFINQIEIMDEIIDGNNNGDTDVDWYEAVDISAVRINNNFIQEGFSKSDINHEEAYEKPEPIRFTETVDVNDKRLHLSSNDVVNKNIEKFFFYDDPRAQKNGGEKCSVTNIIEIL